MNEEWTNKKHKAIECWDYISWERLGIPQEDVANAAQERSLELPAGAAAPSDPIPYKRLKRDGQCCWHEVKQQQVLDD